MTEKIYQAELCNICGSIVSRRVQHFAEWPAGLDPVKDAPRT